jgi:hypothetical protein
MGRSDSIRTLFAVPLALAAAHCATAGNVGDLRARAAFDLACPSDALQLQALAERTYGVDGCGKRATYVWAYQNQSWLLDSRSSSAGAEASAPAAAPAIATPASSAAPASNAPPPATAMPAVAAPPSAPAAPAPRAAPAGDPKACESAQDYRRRAAASSGAAQAQLARMAERKEAECRAQKEP